MSGALKTHQERHEAFLSFVPKFDSWEEEKQQNALALLSEVEADWQLSSQQIAELKQAALECDEEFLASEEEMKELFKAMRK